MSIEESISDLASAIRMLAGAVAGKVIPLDPVQAEEPKSEPKKRSPKAKAVEPPAEGPKPVEPPAEETQNAEETKGAAELTADDVRAILQPIIKLLGAPAVGKVLNNMGYTKLTEVPAEKYQELVDAATELTK